MLLQSKQWKEKIYIYIFKACFYWYSTNNNNVIRAIKSSSTVKLFLEDESMKCFVLLAVFATETEQTEEFDNALMLLVLSAACVKCYISLPQDRWGFFSCCLVCWGFSLPPLHNYAQLVHKTLHAPSSAATGLLVPLGGSLSFTYRLGS